VSTSPTLRTRPRHLMPTCKVPIEVRTAILGYLTRKEACKRLRISESSFNALVDPYALVRPELLAKVSEALRADGHLHISLPTDPEK